jgi:hypothetical protein
MEKKWIGLYFPSDKTFVVQELNKLKKNNQIDKVVGSKCEVRFGKTWIPAKVISNENLKKECEQKIEAFMEKGKTV